MKTASAFALAAAFTVAPLAIAHATETFYPEPIVAYEAPKLVSSAPAKSACTARQQDESGLYQFHTTFYPDPITPAK